MYVANPTEGAAVPQYHTYTKAPYSAASLVEQGAEAESAADAARAVAKAEIPADGTLIVIVEDTDESAPGAPVVWVFKAELPAVPTVLYEGGF
jgi:hypothetical protein